MEIPSTDWKEGEWPEDEPAGAPILGADWQPVAGQVRHTFTHFRLELRLVAARLDDKPDLGGVWCPSNGFDDSALPTQKTTLVRLGVGAKTVK